MKRLYTLILCLFCFAGLAQDSSEWLQPQGRSKVIGLNTTPLLVQLIPFNRSNPMVVGPYFISTRSYSKKNKAFRFGFGWDLQFSDFGDGLEQNHFNLRLGYDKRRDLSRRWSYTTGMDFVISGGDFNIPGDKQADSGFLGLGGHWGVDYFINQNISLSTELMLLVGLETNNGDLNLRFIPPVAINLNLWRPSKRNK